MNNKTKNIIFALTATASIASLTAGAVSFVQFAKTDFTGLQGQEVVTPEKPGETTKTDISNFSITGNTITGYNGVLPSNLVIPSTYSLGEFEDKETEITTYEELETFIMQIQDTYFSLGANFDDEIFEYTFTEGNLETVCKTLQQLDDYRNKFNMTLSAPVKITWQEQPIVEGNDYVVTDLSLSFLGNISLQDEIQVSNVKEITIPASITNITSSSYFTYFTNLEKFNVDETNTKYKNTEDGLLIERSSNAIIAFPSAISGDYVMPDNLNFAEDYSYQMFKNSKLNSFTLNNVIESIPQSLFAYSNCDVILGDNVRTLEKNSFYAYSGNVTLNNNLEMIESSAFSNSTITNIELPNSLQTIGSFAFAYSGLTSITIPESVVVLQNDCFRDCEALIDATLLCNIDALPGNIFNGCSSLTSVSLPSTIKIIRSGALYGTAIENLVIPEGVEYIQRLAITGDALKSIDLPSTLKGFLYNGSYDVSNYVFDFCDNLETIIFRNTDTLPQAYNASATSTLPGTLRFAENNVTLYVPTNLLADYQSSYTASNYTIEDLANYQN